MQHKKEMDPDKIYRLLFDAVRSLPDAQIYFEENKNNDGLLQILFDVALSDSSDAVRVQACYYISQYPPHLLAKHEDPLLKLQSDTWESVSDHAIVALAKISSVRGFEYLIEKRIAPKSPWEAMVCRYYLSSLMQK